MTIREVIDWLTTSFHPNRIVSVHAPDGIIGPMKICQLATMYQKLGEEIGFDAETGIEEKNYESFR